jgi:uncharacterized protein (TIGR00369 family)
MRDDVQTLFERQPLMTTLGVTLVRVADGEVELHMPFQPALTQHGGVLHAGVVTAIVDSACGFAAATLLPAGRSIVSVEFKLNLLAPAAGDAVHAIGRVIRAGRTLTVCAGDVWAVRGDTRTHVALMQATMMSVADER